MVRVSTPRQSGGPVIGGSGGSGPENLTAQVHVVSSLDASNCDPAEVAPLSRCAFFSYAVGHVLNDMCASCWFTYLLVYLQKTPDIALHSGEAAGVLLAGQVADAIATPLVGVFSDRSKGCAALGFGRRKFWFFTGTLMAAACFFLVFGQCLPCSITDGAVGETYLLLYYCAAASFFNVGWAAVQVSHMSMVPELTPLDAERVALNSARYAFTVLSNVAVFVIFFILIQLNGGSKDGPADSTLYRRLFHLLCYLTLGVGGLCSAVFLIFSDERIKCSVEALKAANAEFTRRRSLLRPADVEDYSAPEAAIAAAPLTASSSLLLAGDSATTVQTYGAVVPAENPLVFSKWHQWLGVREFYQVGWIYMACRIVVNVSQVLIPFYLLDFLLMDQASITIVPLILYVAQFIATFFIKSLNAAAGRKGSLTVGSVIVFAACALFYFLRPTSTVYVYPAIALLGIGCAIVMVVSQQLQADLVGQNTTQGAFVYGAHSFADKLSNGVAIFVVQKINGDANTYVREFLVFVPAAAMLLALLFTYLLDLALMDGGGQSDDSQTLPKAATAAAGASAAPTPRRALADRMDSKLYQPISSSIE